MIFKTIISFLLLAKPLFPKSNLSRKKDATLLFPYSLILGNNKGTPQGSTKSIRENEKGTALLLRGLSLVLCTKCEAKIRVLMEKQTNKMLSLRDSSPLTTLIQLRKFSFLYS